MRILGLDYGEKTLGVAVSDELEVTARELETIERERPTHLRRTFARLEALIEEYGIQKAVLGLPLNMDGSEGDRAEKTRAFAEALERRTGLEIIFQDERLTTVEADEILEERGVPRQQRKKTIDALAAALILQDYLNHI